MTNSVQPVKPGLHTSEFHPTVRVQDDLFRFTNGTWIDSFEMPADQSTYGSFMLLRDLSEERVKAIIEDAAANPKPGVSQQIGDMYASFMNEERANELGVAPIAADLKKIAELGSIAEVTELLGELSAAGSDVLFGMYIDNDPGNPERYLVNIYQGGLGLPDEAYYHEEKHAEVRDAYVPFIAEMLELAGWSAADADAAAHHIYNFELALSKHHWTVVESRDAEKVYNLRKFDELQALSGNFDWNLWLKGTGLGKNVLEESVVMMPSFLEGLDSVYTEANLESIKLWIAFHLSLIHI